MNGYKIYQLLSDKDEDYSKKVEKITKIAFRKRYNFSIKYYHRYWMGAAAFLCMCVLMLQPLLSTLLTSDAIIAKGGPCFQMVVGDEIIPLSVSRSFSLAYDSQIGLNAFYKEYDSLDQVNALIGEKLLLPIDGSWQLSSDSIDVAEGIGQSIVIRAKFTNEYNPEITAQVLLQSDRWSNQEHNILVGESDQEFCHLIDQYPGERQDTDIYVVAYGGEGKATLYAAFFVWNDMVYIFRNAELDVLHQFLTML